LYEIKEFILWIIGISHPFHLGRDNLASYLRRLPSLTDMTPLGEPRIEESKMIMLPDKTYCDGLHAFQLWKTSGVAIYTWEVGKISITIHTCKEFDTELVKDFTVHHFAMQEHKIILMNSE
jgi:hypothetical protein